MANANDRQKIRKKRQQEILPEELIRKSEQQFSDVVNEAIVLRKSVFETENQYSIDDLGISRSHPKKSLLLLYISLVGRGERTWSRSATPEKLL